VVMDRQMNLIFEGSDWNKKRRGYQVRCQVMIALADDSAWACFLVRMMST